MIMKLIFPSINTTNLQWIFDKSILSNFNQDIIEITFEKWKQSFNLSGVGFCLIVGLGLSNSLEVFILTRCMAM